MTSRVQLSRSDHVPVSCVVKARRVELFTDVPGRRALLFTCGRRTTSSHNRVGRGVSAGCRCLTIVSRRERGYVLVESLGRWTNGIEDSKALLCRRQWIAVESKGRCFLGKLKFRRIV